MSHANLSVELADMESVKEPLQNGGNQIRVIDFSPWRDPSSTLEERNAVIAALRYSCTTHGFFQLVGHGVPLALQKQVLECARTFFAQPMAEKMAVSIKKSMGRANRGYETLQGQTLQPGMLPDLKEIGAEVPGDDPRAGRFLQGPNLWPPSLPKMDFEAPLMEYRGRLVEIAELLLDLLRQALPGPPRKDLFDEFRVRPSTNLRLLHYPPQTSTDARQMGGITLLLQQPGASGLEVLHPSSCRWIPVPATEGCLVVNIGDLLNLWTDGYYVSAVHRVLNREPKHRFSAPFFYNGNIDCHFTPLDLDGKTSSKKAQTVEEHICGKLTASMKRITPAAIATDSESVETEVPIRV
ncbi:MAG: hypothetical protein Q9165_008496 [Trypethelium subeluteriae]